MSQLNRIALLFRLHIEGLLLHHLHTDLGKIGYHVRILTVSQQSVLGKLLTGTDILRQKLLA